MALPSIAVWSPKGGVGKTLIATGLATHLVRRCGAPTLLIDLDPGNAGAAPLLQVSLLPSVLGFAAGGQTVAHPTGLRILPGPSRLVDESLVTGQLAEAVLARARSEGFMTVLDLDADLRDSTVVALEQADAVLLVTTPDLLSIYACRRFMQEAQQAGFAPGKFRLVINRATARQEIPDAEILDLVHLPLAGKVPSLPGLAAAINRGMATATFRSNTEFAAAVHLIADSLEFAGVPAPPVATITRPLEQQPVGLIPALKRWWHSL